MTEDQAQNEPQRSQRPPAWHPGGRRVRFGLMAGLLVLAVAFALAGIALRPHSGSTSTTDQAGALPTNHVRIGATAPRLDLPALSGATIDLAKLRGHPVLLNFWASWCHPCQQEFPLLRSISARARAKGLVIVGVLVDDRASSARSFIRAHGGTWASTVSAPAATQAAYDIVGLPDSFFVRANGTVGAVQVGPLTATTAARDLATILPG